MLFAKKDTMFKRITLYCLGIILLGTQLVFGQSVKKPLQVVTTLFPLYDFTRQVGQDKVTVMLLLPPGVEAHTFEPKPSDIIKINKSDVFLFTNIYMEPWALDLIKGTTNTVLTVVDASQDIELMTDKDRVTDAEQHEARHTDEHHHARHGKDPHTWLDLENAQIMVHTIASALAKKDPSNSMFYMANATAYNQRLADLDRRFKQTLSRCRQRIIVYGGHFAFGYFTRRYGLSYISPYAGFSPNAEPTPKAIADLIRTLKNSRTKYIYHEELLDPMVSRVIASETGAKLLLLHGAHNVSKDALKTGVTFTGIMEENLKKLKLGLECDENN